MADNVSKQRRSEIMTNVKGKDTKPELVVRRFLFSRGFRYRLHDKNLPSKPDIKLTKYNTVILINGCFWHGHADCRAYVMPKTNSVFWKNKIEKNVARDQRNIKALKDINWNVIILWGCELKKNKLGHTLRLLEKKILENTKR